MENPQLISKFSTKISPGNKEDYTLLVTGVFIEACMTGIVFAKFTKPTHRGKTIVFSRAALVTMRNGVFYLLCRVADLRPTHLIGKGSFHSSKVLKMP